MFNLISFMLDKGIPEETIIFLLMVPIIVTIIAFTRQIIGIRAFGIYTPLITAFAFLGTGLKYGIGLFIIVLIAGTIMRFLVKKLRLLYLPRIAIVLTIVGLSVLLSFAIMSAFGQNEFLNISIFPILIMIVLVEKFVGAQTSKSLQTAIMLSLETLILSLISYFILNWEGLKQIILKYPWLILATIIINIILGRWTGLRIIELWRFRAVIKHVENTGKK